MDKRAKTSDSGKILERITGDDAELRDVIAEEKLNVRVAQMIHDARTAAGITQVQLAELVGTTQSVISRLEDADYEGRSLTMLGKVAKALNHQLELRFVRTESPPLAS